MNTNTPMPLAHLSDDALLDDYIAACIGGLPVAELEYELDQRGLLASAQQNVRELRANDTNATNDE